MALNIEKLHMDIPASLGARKQAIMRLLNAELKRHPWPHGNIKQLNLPSVAISTTHTNIAIARAIASAMYSAVTRDMRHGKVTGGKV